MPTVIHTLGTGRPVLLMVAAPAEAAATAGAFGRQARTEPFADPWVIEPLSDAVDMVQTGVGKSNPAAAAASLACPDRYGAVLNLGVCGALPVVDQNRKALAACGQPGGLSLGTVVLASISAYADEGVVTPTGFLDCGRMKFPLGDFPGGSGVAIPGSARLIEVLQPLSTCLGPVATVSTCSGTDAAARDVAARTGAVAEAMEGAAAAHVIWRLWRDRLPFAELRVVSNTTGDRDRQRWDLRGALAALTELVRIMTAE